MMEQAVKKMDELFIAALNSGQLRADSTLTFTPETIAEEDLAPLETALPEVKEKVEKPKDDKEADDPVEKELRKADEEERKNDNPNDKPAPLAVPVTTQTVSVQANTATAADVDRAEASLRGIPGVQSVSTTSLALGGTSVIRVTYQGDPDAFKAALSARGFR
jgi:hypothetical protein